MQNPRHRIRKHRHPIALASATALIIATLASASSNLPVSSRASGGPAVATARAAGTAPCRIPATMGVQMSEGLPTPEGYARSTGRIHALILMIDFPDAPGPGPAMDRFDEFFPQTIHWFRTASYGRLTYVPDAPVKSWLRMPLPFSEYGIERGSPYEPGYRHLVQDIVATADPKVDFSTYDLVNILVTPNAGPSALDTVLSVTFSGNQDAPHADGAPLGNTSFIYSHQDDGSGSFKRNGFRVLPHENGHIFGLPDLYTVEGGGAVGHWDIMSEDWGADNDLLGWHKWKLGWLDNKQISCAARPGTSDHVLEPLATRGGTKLAFVPLSDVSGYAVEVRTQAGNDQEVCRPGVLIYKVSTDVDTGQGPVSVMDSTKDSSGCTRLPNVHAELSDATFRPGQTFTDRAHGIRISVVDKEDNGNYRVRVTRP
ncbi:MULTISPECIES: M6 family metalloprotease domain-containing protein [unclassified Streptomyces]|uniref:M6 family metalloprotease domain-containing protein n=1 Tax=unclassified Streptomyces TaxID=2593676 RepID=UPI00224DEF38|nr:MULTISPECIES: M6 family metalloprotease domain-containing protein [unclassified Streptomyces]WSP55618.1 M6 family metalloprotease domain-containing protein [Streptomyces sp. NBC_01241]WSU23654.1 M6 family metalloprotease domain-containing protein [Streptomyces sp. NBC_01108]MCX4787319.1 M6 family metalloprotease domain-containing protein [Streptomyces sp. NBC_01221]MCX4796896.1 M6 family metalloprotease domain-containing protein [Streptomyces sp. NBC_01242]WSJ38218.1 M6 family metalloprotea